jgi:hypothetical protein
MAINQITISAPSGGLNTKNNPVMMEQTDAIIMKDAVVEEGVIHRRDGFVPKEERLGFVTQDTGEFDLLPIELAPDHKQVLMRLGSWTVGGTVYTGGIVYGDDGFVTCTQSTLTSFRADYIKFAGQQIYVPDGILDVPHYYKHDNTTFADTLIPCNLTHADPDDGFDPKKLFKVESHGKRLFFLEDGTMRLWYIDQVGAFQGNMEYIDVSYLAKTGTKLVELVEWTRTGADSINTMLMAFSDEGEVFVWTGLDPEGTDWTLAGTYYIPPPIGTRCVVQVGSDVLVMTEKGLYSADDFTAQNSQNKLIAFSDKIEKSIKEMNEDLRATGGSGSLYFSSDRKEVWWLWGSQKTPHEVTTRWNGQTYTHNLFVNATDILFPMAVEPIAYKHVFQSLIDKRVTRFNFKGGFYIQSSRYYARNLSEPGELFIAAYYKNHDGQFIEIGRVLIPPTPADSQDIVVTPFGGDFYATILPFDWDGCIYMGAVLTPEGNRFTQGIANIGLTYESAWANSYLDVTSIQYTSVKKNRIEDGLEHDRQAFVYHMDTQTWSIYEDAVLYPERGAYIFSNLKGLCDYKGQLNGVFSLRKDGTQEANGNSCIAALEEGGIEFDNRMSFAIHQAYSDLGNPNVKKISYIVLNCIIPYEDTDIAVSFYADFEFQSVVRVPVSGYKLDPKTGKIPPQQIHVDCPCNPCVYFAIRLDVTSSTETPHMFEWISTQVFFKEGVI